MKLLKLIRVNNLILLAAAQCIIKFIVFPAFKIETALTGLQFSLLIAATVLIAAGGYIINDIYDLKTDTINKPERVIIGNGINEGLAYNLYMGFTLTGVISGFFLANGIDKNALFSVFVLVALLLYVYSSWLKQKPVIGNIIVALLAGYSLLIVPIFDLMPAITEFNRVDQSTMLSVIFDFSIFAFLINLVREIVKDCEDINGDHAQGMSTLPIVLGVNRSAKIAFGLVVLICFVTVYYLTTYFYKHTYFIAYLIATILAPLIYTAIKLFSAKTKKEFTHISFILKIAILLSICAMVGFKFIM